MGKRGRSIVIIAGEGGHTAQMLRLRRLLASEHDELVCIGEVKRHGIDFVSPFGNAISSYSKSTARFRYLVILPLVFITLMWSIFLFIKLRPKGVIFLGPLFCVPFMITSKLMIVRSLFIESWSRFDSSTISAKLTEVSL